MLLHMTLPVLALAEFTVSLLVNGRIFFQMDSYTPASPRMFKADSYRVLQEVFCFTKDSLLLLEALPVL